MPVPDRGERHLPFDRLAVIIAAGGVIGAGASDMDHVPTPVFVRPAPLASAKKGSADVVSAGVTVTQL